MKRKPAKRKKKSQGNFVDKEMRSLKTHHKVLFTLIGASGVILVWRGLWGIFDTTPFLNHPVASFVVGLTLVIASGFLFRVV